MTANTSATTARSTHRSRHLPRRSCSCRRSFRPSSVDFAGQRDCKIGV